VSDAAVKLIVDGYVSLKDCKALEELREHRQRLRKDLLERSGRWFDVSRSIQVFDNDLEVIEAAFAKLSLDTDAPSTVMACADGLIE
jgi:hypothetical protein